MRLSPFFLQALKEAARAAAAAFLAALGLSASGCTVVPFFNF